MTTNITLPPDLSIAEVEVLKSSLLEQLGSEGPVVLMAGAVDRIDTAGVQLLLALVKTLQNQERTFGWCEVSERLLDAASGLGLTAHLQIPTK